MADEKIVDTLAKDKLKRQAAEKWLKQDHYAGSKYPPFSIEPVPYERQRLAGSGMSPEDRALRKQWIKDQELSPNEPRHVKELAQRNIFRRIYQAPANIVFGSLIPVIGKLPASLGRFIIPKLMMASFVGYLTYYQLKYHPNDWTRRGGWNTYSAKPTILSKETPAVEKQHNDFHDQGFKSRKVLINAQTSGQ